MAFNKFITCVTFSVFASAAVADEFRIDFEWGDIELCVSGRPNTVTNPIFKLENVPDGTTWIHFKLVDLNVPGFNHGGGWVEYTGQTEVASGWFDYKSPCPPNGKHKYQWTATAKKKKSSWGGTITKAKSSKMYP